MRQIAHLPNKRVAVSVQGDVVLIELILGDAYEAEVLGDDLADRLKAGIGLVLELQAPRPSK